MILDTLWRVVQREPVLVTLVSVAALSVLLIWFACWWEERRLQRIWAIEDRRDQLRRERDRLWKDGA